jgi:hypothetical protein
MDRQPPRATSDEIDLYIRTYYSLLRSSGEVKVRAFEEAHIYSRSSLHLQADSPTPDTAAFAYASGRLPECMPQVRHLVLGQSHEQFESADVDVSEWVRVRTRGRRRPLRWDGKHTLAVWVTSTSDIDDLVPIVTAYQLEWNKLHRALATSPIGRALRQSKPATPPPDEELAKALEIPGEEIPKLKDALGRDWLEALSEIARRECDLSIRLLNGSYSEYQRAAQRWWGGIEPAYLRPAPPRRPPVYFVSSNTHSLNNVLGGYAVARRHEVVDFARRRNPEGLAEALDRALAAGREDEVTNLTYYLLRAFIHEGTPTEIEARRGHVQRFDQESGITSIESPGRIDVSAQVINLSKLTPERLDPRLRVPGVELLKQSNAVLINIDYPLGMAAYHHLSRLGQGVGDIRGLYIMGKAATLNGRVGDVMISNVVHDEHSQNTYLLKNCFTAADVQPYLQMGTVFDNQKALTVRSAFLQNREYMSVFYREGYTVLEMEAGPYLSATYELVNPNRHPKNEIVHLSTQTPFDFGLLHYASDTPYSRRQSLLSKSLSYFGVDSTYACSVAMVRRIFKQEIARIRETESGTSPSN